MGTFLVAEVGLNHMGSEDYADEYLAHLFDSGFDAVEFQVREAGYYKKDAERAALALSEEYYARAIEYAHKKGLRFGVALSDIGKLAFFERVGADFYKVLSKDLFDQKMVSQILATGRPVYGSTGTASEAQIAEVVGWAKGNLTLIHTQLSYRDEEVNLRAIARLRNRFGVPVAFGLHATTHLVLYGAVAFDPVALFVYVKGGRVAKHRDEDHALSLVECASVANSIRRLETMLGDGVKAVARNTIPDQTTGR